MDIFEILESSRNEDKALQMAAYMKNKFPFLGIQKPDRAMLSKEFLKKAKASAKVDWDFVRKCYEVDEREFQYLAIDYISAMRSFMEYEDIFMLESYITQKSWWDSVDSLSPIVGYMSEKYPGVKEGVIEKWITSENIWLKRSSIIFQLKYKEKTDTVFMRNAVLSNKDTGEFFVDKAIGWALREYSKTDPDWVKGFLKENMLSKLSAREASKYI